jgi:hypothetical protein
MDARTALQARGVDAVLVETLRRVFERGEAHRYAGVGAAGDDRPGEEALVLAARLDKVLG